MRELIINTVGPGDRTKYSSATTVPDQTRRGIASR
jgi:hypothetical protein